MCDEFFVTDVISQIYRKQPCDCNVLLFVQMFKVMHQGASELHHQDLNTKTYHALTVQ